MAQKYILEEQIPNLGGGGDEPQFPNNDIWYTYSIGNVVVMSDDYAFGEKIVSNTYSGGKGIIKFDGDVTSIGSEAFGDCTGLTSITIPNSVTRIGDNAFCGCTSLTSITIPNRVWSIGNSAFKGCNSLTSITIPNSVMFIGNNAFNGNDNLHTIIFDKLRGANVCDIDAGAFNGCPNLKTVIVDSAEDAEIIFKKIPQNTITFDIVISFNIDENGVIVKDI